MFSVATTQPSAITRQRGATLIVALMFLLILTILGVSSLSTVTLEERMAGNVKDVNTAFQAAESALRDGEADMANISAATVFPSTAGTCVAGLCSQAAVGGTDVWNTSIWSGATSKVYGSVSGATALSKVASQPRYIIEDIPDPTSPPADKKAQGGGVSAKNSFDQTQGGTSGGEYYRITARGTGASDTTQVILQTIHRK